MLLSGAGPGTSIEVLWSDGPTARISAAPGSSFTFGAGRAEAMVAPGPVRVELPRSAERVRLEVDGRTLLRRTSSGLEVLEPVVEQTEAGIRFLTPER